MDLKQSDELIVCDECDTLCIHGDCPDHGPLEWVDDLEQPSGQHKSKARGSLPSFLYLMPSAAGQGRLGVFTRTRIEKRVMFGPFKGLKVPVENFTAGEQKTTMYMWDVLKDGKVQHIVDATDEQTSNWTRFVNCAHSDTEQNLVAVQFRGELYYKTCKAIECGSELLVWYNNSCTKAMDNAEQQEKNGWDFVCDCCRLAFAGSTFLLRHKALRCPATSGASDNSMDEIDVMEPAGTDASSAQDNYAPADEETYVVVNIPLISQPVTSESANSRRKKIVSKSHKRPLVAAKKGSSSGKRFKLKRSVGAAKKTRTPAGKSRSSQARSTSSSRGRKSQSLSERTKRTSSTKKTVAAGKSKKSETGRRNASKVRKSSEAARSKSQTRPKKARKSSSAGKAKASKSRKVSSGDNEATAPTTDDETMSSGGSETSATPRRAKRSKVTGNEGAPKKKRGKPAVVKVPKEKPTYMCETCGKTFKWKSSLDYHVRSHASEKAFKCTICDKGLSQLSSLKRHLLMHSGEKPFKCDACGRGFLERGKLAWHQRLAHSGEVMVMEKKYKCPQCQWCFALSANLRSHMRTHTGERPFPCPQCGKCFKRSPDVVSHLRSHTGERPYKCSHCGKGFTMLSHRNRHEMIHTGAKPFKCSLCDKSFNQKVSVAAHEKVHARKQARLEKAGTDQQTDDPAEESLS